MMMGQQGAGLLIALMIVQHANGLPQADTGVSAARPHPVLIASTQSDAQAGAFRRLSPRDQRIARNLLDAEQVGNGPAWSLDRIAAAHASGKDWETVVIAMQAERLVAAGDPAVVIAGAAGPKGSESMSDLAVASGPDGKSAKPAEVAAVPGAKGDTGCSVNAGKLQFKGKDLVEAE